ncbi:MAG: hypothetical protein J7L46_07370 [Bacteroidales bacterium]|nr:hypothetical protein [Bacteroidales bacterium]
MDKDQKEWQKKIEEIRDYAEEQFDKLIVYLNSGALVLSIGFIKDIVKITKATDLTILKTSWIFFTMSLLIILISHKTAIKSMNLELKEREKESDSCDKCTKILNWISFGFLIIGITFFIIFILKAL